MVKEDGDKGEMTKISAEVKKSGDQILRARSI